MRAAVPSAILSAVVAATSSGAFLLPAQAPQPSLQQLGVLTTADGVEVSVRLGDEDAVLVLQPWSVRAPGFVLLVDDGRALRAVPPPAPATYRGSVRSRGGSVAASIDGDRVTAIVHDDGAVWGIQPCYGAHFVHRHDAVAHSPLQCGCVHGNGPPTSSSGTAASIASTHVFEAELAIDADHDFWVRHGSSVAATVHAIEAVMNPVDQVYRRDTQIRYRLTAIVVRTQPLYTTPGVAGRLADFQNHWNTSHAAIPRDAAHLFTGVFDLALYGIANLSSVCNVPQAYAVSAAYQPLHVDNVVLVAHELGHNWDAPHCLSWPCYIMCPMLGCATAVEFGPLESQPIVAWRDAQTCLTTIAAGAFAPFGSGCVGTTGVPAITATGRPVFGQTFALRLGNARPNSVAILTIGHSDAIWQGIPLPWTLTGLGAPGCALLAAADVPVAVPTTALGAATWSLAMPVVPELFGITLFSQWVVVDPAANGLGLAFSDGGAWTVGDQ